MPRWSTAAVRDAAAEPDHIKLSEFLVRNELRVEDIYRNRRSWTQLRREAGKAVPDAADPELESRSLGALGRLLHVDDPERVALYREILAGDDPPEIDSFGERQRRLLTMLAWGLGSGGSGHGTLGDYLAALWSEVAVRGELLEILDSLDARSQTVAAPSPLSPEIPLTVHARYSRQEIVAALGFGSGVKPKVTQGGILWIPEARSDVFFVDLQKAERDYSPTTMYRDYAISRDLFHWESQSRQTPEQPSVQRYINHAKQGTNVLLCVREQRRGELGAAPYHFLGPVDHVSHAGERPVAFTWRLRTPMPEALFEVARSVAA